MIHLIDEDGYRVCGMDTGAGQQSTTDYHQVNCPKCHEWIKEHAVGDARKRMDAAIDDGFKDLEYAPSGYLHDQRRWELAKELYLRNECEDNSCSIRARRAVEASDALLNAFDTKQAKQ